MEPKARRGFGRWLTRLAAFVALVGAVVAVAVVVAGSIDGGDERKGERKGGPELAGCQPEFEDAVASGYYVVQENDLLSLIAQRTCVPEDDLLRLNPNIDPQNLEVGRCVNLEERACATRAA